MPSECNNTVILAAAGSRKTEFVIESALELTDQNVLITTYTSENRRHILQRIEDKVGIVPKRISVLGWFSFLMSQCVKPYQRAKTDEPLFIKGLNFKGRRPRYTKKSDIRYFIDGNNDLYRDGVSDLVIEINQATQGAVIGRLQKIYDHIFIDEVQDLVGYDLDVLDLLFESDISMLLVGDPRQCTLETNLGPRNKKYRGAGLADWFAERETVCNLEPRDKSYRCNQKICDFADAIFPRLPPTSSVGVGSTDHDGVFEVPWEDVEEYVAKYAPDAILRHSRRADTKGLPAMNIGVAKGRTFDRVLIFPTKPMLRYLRDRDEKKLKAPERLYVAVTRARYSVSFVMPELQQ